MKKLLIILAFLISILVVSSSSAQMLMGITGGGSRSGTFTQTISVNGNSVGWTLVSGTPTGFAITPYLYAGGGLVATQYYNSNLFTSVTVPKNAVITSATLQVGIQDVYGTPATRCYGEAADNPTAVTTAVDGNSRALTTAYIDPGITTTGTKTLTVTTIVQELVNRAGWVSGQNMNLMLRDNGSLESANNFYDDYGSLASYPRVLTINYTY